MAKLGRIAVAWLREDEWPRWLELDSNFQRDYAGWRVKIDKEIGKYAEKGYTVVKIDVGIDDFTAWCRVSGAKVDTNSRAKFAVFLLTAKDHHH